MSCPMNCPKQVRNGPCGGVRRDGTCEANPGMPCVGLEGWRGAARMAGGRPPLATTAPPEHDRAGSSTWLPIILGEPAGVLARRRRAGAAVGQPRCEGLLASGAFVVTAEFSPPDSADPADVAARLAPFRGCVDALNVTDASGANCHMSSLAVSVLLAQAGCEPVMQVACRDRNRIAIQGDMLGAAALGVRNVLCLTGDHVGKGDHPGARHVGDLDSMTLLATARKMRDAGRVPVGAQARQRAAAVPGRRRQSRRRRRSTSRSAACARKIAAGAQFVQTQYCFDLERLERVHAAACARKGCTRRAALIIGVGPIASAKTARWLRANVPGVHIPDAIVARLEQAADPREEGRRIAVELIRGIRAIRGVAGVHIMAYRQERMVPSIVAESGVLAGRAPLFAASQALPATA